jgi:3-oxoacyl-[acyl-carrier protein] reductase
MIIINKVILITGASRGIGREMALSFANEGYLVAANYNKSINEAEKLKAMSSNILIYKADVSNEKEVMSWLMILLKNMAKLMF